MAIKGTLTLSKWGNSLSIRLPKEALDNLDLKQGDKLDFHVEDKKIVLKPVKKVSAIEKLFEGYDMSQPYPYEIVDKGGAIGEELY